MNRILLGCLFLALILIQSCQKEQIRPVSSGQTDENSGTEKIDKPKLTYVACHGRDASGETCIGKRCADAPGSDCKVVQSGCNCTSASKNFKLPAGMTLEEFNETWETREGTRWLESLGYSQYDL